jgi:hypothetical protein
MGPASSSEAVKKAMLTDFYNWCIAKSAFTADQVTLEAFIGENFNGLWFNYTGNLGNPSDLYTNHAQTGNFFLAHTGDNKTNGVIAGDDNVYFLNDATYNAKWGPFMAHVEKLFNSERVWSVLTGYGMHDLGRYMQTFNGANTWISIDSMKAVPAGYEEFICEARTDKQEFTVYSLVSENTLPVAAKEGCVFVGWTAGGKAYDAITAAELSGKTLTPVFVDTTNTNVFDIKWASARQAAKGEGALSITNATYTNGAIWPSAVFRDKVLLKYTEDGKLEVVAVGLNGVRLSKNSSDSYYVEGQSNLDFDLVIIGYSAEADTVIKGLNLEAGDIIEIAALNSVYDVLDGADPDNWTPDHEVNVKAYITYAN